MAIANQLFTGANTNENAYKKKNYGQINEAPWSHTRSQHPMLQFSTAQYFFSFQFSMQTNEAKTKK